jgi:hypothetical protein
MRTGVPPPSRCRVIRTLGGWYAMLGLTVSIRQTAQTVSSCLFALFDD